MLRVSSALAAFVRGCRRYLDSDRFQCSLLVADGLVAWAIAAVHSGFTRPVAPDWGAAQRFALALVVVHAVFMSYSPAARPRRIPPWILLLAVNGVAAALLAPSVTAGTLGLRGAAMAALLFAPAQLCLHGIRRRSESGPLLEPFRIALVVVAGVAVGLPLLTRLQVGSGDAYWYAASVGDFALQWRAGIFPVLVGQSDFAFSGSVSPVRLAPYLQHAAGLLDVATWHTLSFSGLLNLTLLLSILAGGIVTYIALIRIDGRTRWPALLFSLLYVAAPAALALVYSGDLFMSACTLPYLPLVMFGTHLSHYPERRLPGVLLITVAVSATWLCHPPIAFWATLVASLGQLPLLVRRESRTAATLRNWLIGAGLFVLLTLYTFVSNYLLAMPGPPVERALIIQWLSDSFLRSLLPVSEGATDTSQHQLGWSLWVLLFVGLAGTYFSRRRGISALGIGAVMLLAFIIPIPWLHRALWQALPQLVVNISFYWPVQRLYVILSAVAVFLAYGILSEVGGRKAWLHFALAAALAWAAGWTGLEAAEYVRIGSSKVAREGLNRAVFLPANRILTRYAINPYPAAPPYFSHGYTDPVWENRLLGADRGTELTSNYAAAIGPAAVTRSEGEIVAVSQDSVATYYMLLDHLAIQPRHHYALEFAFAFPELTGTFVGESPSLIRTYDMPDSGIGLPFGGKPAGFGSLSTSKKAIPLVIDSDKGEDFRLQFVASPPTKADITKFGRYALKEYDPAELPVKIESLTPYRARVRAPAGTEWLETPRLYLEGYRARVNGEEKPVTRSPGGLVMVRVPAGESRVELTYPGPIGLRLAYFASLAGWLGVLAYGCARLARKQPGPPAAIDEI